MPIERPDQRLAWVSGGEGTGFIRSKDWRYTVAGTKANGVVKYEAWRTNRDANGQRPRGAPEAEALIFNLPDIQQAKAVCELDALRGCQ